MRSLPVILVVYPGVCEAVQGTDSAIRRIDSGEHKPRPFTGRNVWSGKRLFSCENCALVECGPGRLESRSFRCLRRNLAGSCRRTGGRAAEGARLESVYTGNGIEGSNPSLSAIFPMKALILQSDMKSLTFVPAMVPTKGVGPGAISLPPHVWVRLIAIPLPAPRSPRPGHQTKNSRPKTPPASASGSLKPNQG